MPKKQKTKTKKLKKATGGASGFELRRRTGVYYSAVCGSSTNE